MPPPSSPEPSGSAPKAPPPVAGNVSWRLAATLARVLLSFVSVPLLTRALGMSQWGLLALFQAATAPLLVLDVGMSAALVKHVAEALGRGAREEAARTVHTVAIFNAVVGAIGASAIAATSPWLAKSAFAIPPEHVGIATQGFRIIAVNWLVVFLGGAFSAVIAAHQKYDRVALIGFLTAAGSTAAAVGVALAGGSIVMVVAAQTAAQLLGAVAWYRSATSLLPDLSRVPRWDRGAFRKTVHLGTWSVIATFGTIVSGWTDRYVLGAFFVPATVGFYAIAHMLQMQVYGVFTEMSDVLFPAVSHRQGLGDLAGARKLSLLAGWLMTIGFGAAATVLAVLGGDFMALWISAEAAAHATGVLRLLCAGGVIGIAAVAPLQYLLGTGAGRAYATASVVTALTIAGTSILLVPRLGIAGAGIGLLLGVIVRTGFVAYSWRLASPTAASIRELAVHLWVAPVVAVVSIAGFSTLHDRVPHEPSWAMLVLETILFATLATAAQFGLAEALPGGRRRREDVVASFRPVLARILSGGARA